MVYDSLFPPVASVEERQGFFEINENTAIQGVGKAVSLIAADVKRYLSVTLKKSEGASSSISLRLVRGKKRGDESYTLEITDKTIVISGSKRGVFWGAQTLRQLIRNGNGLIPCGRIVDKPILGARGIMLDCTRGKVFTLKTLKRIADMSALYKINQLQIYVENCVDFPFAKELWEKGTPLTAEEIKAFDRYCAALNIELVPCFATFGHLYNLLEVPKYHHLQELGAGDPEKGYWIKKMCHHTLDVTNTESFEMVKKIIDYAVPLFRSEKFNICCDETFDLGKGKSAELAKEKGAGRVYVDFLNFVIRYTKQYKKEIQIWGDIILQHEELISEIEPGCVFLNWDYSKDVKPDKTKVFAEAGVRQYACPGTQGWNHALNNLNSAFSNISKFAGYAIEFGAEGMLNTDWGDYGHINPVSSSVPAYIYGAGASWARISDDLSQFDKTISRLEYGCEGVVSALKKATMHSVATWGNIVGWWYLSKGELESSIEERVQKMLAEKLALPQTKVKAAMKDAREAYKELSALKKHVFPDKRACIDEMLTGIKGELLIQKWVLAIKKLDGRSADIDLANYATELERFSTELARRWVKFYKESELWRLQRALSEIAQSMKNGVVN